MEIKSNIQNEKELSDKEKIENDRKVLAVKYLTKYCDNKELQVIPKKLGIPVPGYVVENRDKLSSDIFNKMVARILKKTWEQKREFRKL